jgi:hypothetical protein
VVQNVNTLTDAGGRLIAEGLKGNCSVTKVLLVSAGLLVRLLLLTMLTCDEQSNNRHMSDAVRREITHGLQECHGADKGLAITANSSCLFFDFETCEEIGLRNSGVRLPSLHDVARRAMHPAPDVCILAFRR